MFFIVLVRFNCVRQFLLSVHQQTIHRMWTYPNSGSSLRANFVLCWIYKKSIHSFTSSVNSRYEGFWERHWCISARDHDHMLNCNRHHLEKVCIHYVNSLATTKNVFCSRITFDVHNVVREYKTTCASNKNGFSSNYSMAIFTRFIQSWDKVQLLFTSFG